MLVTWKLPPASQQNGVITGYKLIMKKRAGPRLAKFTVEAARYNYTFVSECHCFFFFVPQLGTLGGQHIGEMFMFVMI